MNTHGNRTRLKKVTDDVKYFYYSAVKNLAFVIAVYRTFLKIAIKLVAFFQYGKIRKKVLRVIKNIDVSGFIRFVRFILYLIIKVCYFPE